MRQLQAEAGEVAQMIDQTRQTFDEQMVRKTYLPSLVTPLSPLFSLGLICFTCVFFLFLCFFYFHIDFIDFID